MQWLIVGTDEKHQQRAVRVLFRIMEIHMRKQLEDLNVVTCRERDSGLGKDQAGLAIFLYKPYEQKT